ncbi:MAG: bifunctional (p)ppGpp synthetase/guanosine-3',5'-bis(diphosphate) 3'-pyrophosphohydrolase [Chlorobi bacterium]|nr:bifunctional (p)ppGpp synthetase/guanosine-3',5'-bis(diphosphate) 3'-pyrophosphohydrolase [Chlorobiota bacterium]
MYVPDAEQEKRDILSKYRQLLRIWRPTKEEDKELVRKAFNFAVDAHKDMRRRSGEPYIYHPIEVTHIVAGEIGLGKTSIICALLHDVVEDTDYTLADIETLFGPKVAKIINGLTKIKDIFDQDTASIQAENFKKILLTLSDDIRVILIKISDRLHNMRTLEAMPKHKQLKISSETFYLYAPLAHRLGLYAIKSELEDLSLKYRQPEIYNTISAKLSESLPDRKRFTRKFIYPIKKSLGLQEFDYEIISRDKSIYSIWTKMNKKNIPLEEIFDLFAIRIIIDTPRKSEKVDCWRVYSLITDQYRPNIERLRDWISIPKANGYEALHTTVMSHEGKWVEVQIRTKRMDEVAEKGFAAHWKYKGATASLSETSVDNWLERIRDMLQTSDSDALDFVDDFQGFLISDEIYVFTPAGELRNLPVKSTVLDFAYAIHSELGNTCIGAKVNQKLVPLNYELRSGDQVEILVSKKQAPINDWFHYVVTARALTQIKQAIKEQKKKFINEGMKKLDDYFRQLDVDADVSNIANLQKKHNYPSLVEMYYDIAQGVIGLKEIKACCEENKGEGWFDMIKRPFTRSKVNENKTLSEVVTQELKKRSKTLVLDNEIHKISYDISSCCNPIPGDDIVGFIDPNEAIKIHRVNCPDATNLLAKYGTRIIKTHWNDKESISFLTGVRVNGVDQKGIMQEMVGIITEKMGLNIRSFKMESDGGLIVAEIMLYVYSTKNLEALIKNLKKISLVKKAERIHSLRRILNS